jgi:starch synthase
MKQEWKDKMEYVTHFYMDWSGRQEYVGILQIVHEGVTFYFVDNDSHHLGRCFAPNA